MVGVEARLDEVGVDLESMGKREGKGAGLEERGIDNGF